MGFLTNPLYAMLFTEDLMEYVLARLGVIWIGNETGIRRFRRHIPKHLFKPQIGMAVCDIIDKHSELIVKCYSELILKGVNCVGDFKYEATITTILYLEHGYNRLKYLELCALFAGIACHCFRNSDPTFARDVASASAQLLAYIINFFILKESFLPNDDWFALLISAQTIRRKIKNGTLYTRDNEDDEIPLPYFDVC
ncbi:uncharacterized protein TNCT_267521 [Trichonephila clavata]|uniref:Uncharacterized protein n=1 Tax=Trichonephila clavata TaxID=2740835 RepID=A0A8X6F0P9_TRICU|nr:uncharacterized protein TNCT_267521 [Trichonephila clavata]